MKLDYKKTMYIGMAFLLISLFWITYDLVITKILIDKFGLNQTWSGIVMALDNVLALFLLPFFGGLSDKSKSKFGKRTPFILLGTVLAAIAVFGLAIVDSRQSQSIQDNTSILEEYALYQAERDILYDGIKTGDTIRIEDQLRKQNLSIEAYDLAYVEWKNQFDQIISRWITVQNPSIYAQAIEHRDNGRWSTLRFTNWELSVYEPMVELSTQSLEQGYLSQRAYLFWVDEVYHQVHDAKLSADAWQLTQSNPNTFIVFIGVLFLALISMSLFRSPAVALMPDVVVKPLRSKGNAVINLMGTIGGMIAILILTILGLDNESFVDYSVAFLLNGIMMLLLLAFFLWKVKEKQWTKEREIADKEYDIAVQTSNETSDISKQKLDKAKQNSLFLILLSVFLWFIGYNAITTKLSDYAPKVLGLGFSMPLLIASGTALISFIPIGILATKIGRRKSILMGIVLVVISFGSVYFLNETVGWFMYVIFAFTGVGWAAINVNSYPMVVELTKGSDVGKYTGYYYAFSMSAQIITPIFSGMLMDEWGRKLLFPYGAFFVGLAFISMFFVKHGDAEVIKKGSILEQFDVEMD
jgi:maltose/moltooligosaccharide transporter